MYLSLSLKKQSRKNHFKENNISDENKLQEMFKLPISYTKICVSDKISRI